jgi:RNA polymerase II-associated factor 1
MKRKFRNELPPLPYDAKCLEVSMDPERFIRYKTTSLERMHRPQLHPPIDLGLFINLIDPVALRLPQGGVKPVLDEQDAFLVRPEVEKAKIDTSRPSRAHFLKTTYIGGSHGPVLSRKRKTEPQDASQEPYAKKTYCCLFQFVFLRRTLTVGLFSRQEMPLSSVIASIQRTFEDAGLPPRHPRKPHLRPARIWPLLPDLDHIGYKHLHVVFNEDPAHMRASMRAVPPTARQISRSLLCSNGEVDDVRHLGG